MVTTLAYLVRRFIAIERATSITQISTSNNLDLESQEYLTGLKWSKIFSDFDVYHFNIVPEYCSQTLCKDAASWSSRNML